MTGDTILTLNAGSSSLKIGIYTQELTLLATGLVDSIGGEGSLRIRNAEGAEIGLPDAIAKDYSDHEAALATVLRVLDSLFGDRSVTAVGHRVVHGGHRFAAPALIDAAVIEEIEGLAAFAPLHQPHNLSGIRAAMKAFPLARQVACFDTAFHRDHPFVQDTFALPRGFYERGVRRYGFHGLSYDYIAGALRFVAPDVADGRVIVAHLGNGASMCGLRAGRSITSTMGFSALDGLPMGTRCGQLDPGVLLYLMEQEGMDAAAISDLLYRRSGLLGLSGVSNDMRTLEACDVPEAGEAIDYFISRIQCETGGIAAALGGIDAFVFCGGIGENSRLVRARVAQGMGWLGLSVDPGRNAANATVISCEDAPVRVMVIPTDEELVIARQTLESAAGVPA
ncbi:acetate/propionate family kinase [Sulfitobacter sp. LCG007]